MLNMAKVHANWWLQAQIIALTLAENENRDTALTLFQLLDDLARLWSDQFGEDFDREIATHSGQKPEKTKEENNNVVPFPTGGKP